jgi:hypothetical protein
MLDVNGSDLVDEPFAGLAASSPHTVTVLVPPIAVSGTVKEQAPALQEPATVVGGKVDALAAHARTKPAPLPSVKVAVSVTVAALVYAGAVGTTVIVGGVRSNCAAMTVVATLPTASVAT